MRRLSRFLVFAGTFGGVLLGRLLHIRYRGEVSGYAAYIAFAAVLAIVAAAVGLPDEPGDWQPAIFSAVLAAAVGTALFSLVRIFTPSVLPRFVLIGVPVGLIPWNVMSWRVAERGRQRTVARERVLAIIERHDIDTLRTDTERSFPLPERLYTLVGAYDPDELEPGQLQTLAEELEATLIVLGSSAQLRESVLQQAEVLHRQAIRVRALETFYDEWLGKLALSDVGRMALLTDISSLHDRQYASLKRVIDVAFALAGSVAFVAVIPFVAIGNLVANRGPMFFRQQRTGLDDVPFRIWKFRTMVPQDVEHEWTTVGDGRVTPFGRVLRQTHVDELPQVLNVLRGTLSFVGPRPEQTTYVEELEKKLPYYSLRHAVKPGLTGWAQVKFRYGASEQDAFEKLQYDLYYLRHHSLVFDLKTISRTVRQVLFARGR